MSDTASRPGLAIPRRARLRSARVWLLTSAIVCFLADGWDIWPWHQNNPALLPQTSAERGDAEEEGADEHTFSTKEQQEYATAPGMPRYLRIPKVGVSARIQPVGINGKGDVGAPRNIRDTGWYENSAKPGEAGTSFMDGHVNRPSLPGVFGRLHELSAGDEILVERGDGKILTYQVARSETKKVPDIDMATILGPHGPEQTLVLMTCAGTLNPASQTYDSREIVYANRTVGS